MATGDRPGRVLHADDPAVVAMAADIVGREADRFGVRVAASAATDPTSSASTGSARAPSAPDGREIL